MSGLRRKQSEKYPITITAENSLFLQTYFWKCFKIFYSVDSTKRKLFKNKQNGRWTVNQCLEENSCFL